MIAVAAKDVEKYTKERIKTGEIISIHRSHYNGTNNNKSNANGSGDGATALKNNRNHSFNL